MHSSNANIKRGNPLDANTSSRTTRLQLHEKYPERGRCAAAAAPQELLVCVRVVLCSGIIVYCRLAVRDYSCLAVICCSSVRVGCSMVLLLRVVACAPMGPVRESWAFAAECLPQGRRGSTLALESWPRVCGSPTRGSCRVSRGACAS